MQHIETVTVGSGGAASITFSAIPQTFTDLVILLSDRSSRSATNDGVEIKLNGATPTGRRLYGSGSSVVSDTSPEPLDGGSTTTANTFSNIQIYIPNYASTTQFKSFSADGVFENNATTAFQSIIAGLYSSNTAVTSVTLSLDTGPLFVEHSSASLYGITAGSDGIVAVS